MVSTHQLMKKSLLIFMLLIGSTLKAQMLYELDTATSNYTEFNGGTNVSGSAWDSSQMITLPFAFRYFDRAYNNIYITFYGVYFTDTGLDMMYFGLHDFIPEDLDISKSPITFDVFGNIGSRILKVQYKNVHEASTSSSFEYVLNVQLWFYEADNRIEIHFGPKTITDPKYTSFVIGLDDADGVYSYGVGGSNNSPVLEEQNSSFDGISEYPYEGQVYIFKPKNWSHVQNIVFTKYKFFQQSEGFTFNSESDASIEIYDVNGKLVTSFDYNAESNNGQFKTEMHKGLYVLVIKIGSEIFTEKLLVQ